MGCGVDRTLLHLFAAVENPGIGENSIDGGGALFAESAHSPAGIGWNGGIEFDDDDFGTRLLWQVFEAM